MPFEPAAKAAAHHLQQCYHLLVHTSAGLNQKSSKQFASLYYGFSNATKDVVSWLVKSKMHMCFLHWAVRALIPISSGVIETRTLVGQWPNNAKCVDPGVSIRVSLGMAWICSASKMSLQDWCLQVKKSCMLGSCQIHWSGGCLLPHREPCLTPFMIYMCGSWGWSNHPTCKHIEKMMK